MKVDVNLNYKNYIFDLYGTLIDIHTEEGELKLWEALAEFYGKQGASYASKRAYTSVTRPAAGTPRWLSTSSLSATASTSSTCRRP